MFYDCISNTPALGWTPLDDTHICKPRDEYFVSGDGDCGGDADADADGGEDSDDALKMVIITFILTIINTRIVT